MNSRLGQEEFLGKRFIKDYFDGADMSIYARVDFQVGRSELETKAGRTLRGCF